MPGTLSSIRFTSQHVEPYSRRSAPSHDGAAVERAAGGGDVVGTGDGEAVADDALETCGESRQPRTHTHATSTAIDRMPGS
jgi:hypothetical protein